MTNQGKYSQIEKLMSTDDFLTNSSDGDISTSSSKYNTREPLTVSHCPVDSIYLCDIRLYRPKLLP
mgnify:FL=1